VLPRANFQDACTAPEASTCAKKRLLMNENRVILPPKNLAARGLLDGLQFAEMTFGFGQFHDAHPSGD
jgi:hypothetical protein